MANYFISNTWGNDANSGLSFDLALKTLKQASALTLAAGDKLWIAADVNETNSTTITIGQNGTKNNYISFIGSPRPAISLTGDFTNGNSTLANINTTITEALHLSRDIIGPDGATYMIGRVISTSSVQLNRVYAGATATGVAFTVNKDEYYDTFNAINDSAWTHKKSDWFALGNGQPIFQVSSNLVVLTGISRTWLEFQNLRLKTWYASGSGGTFSTTSANNWRVKNVVVDDLNNAWPMYYNGPTTSITESCVLNIRTSGCALGAMIEVTFKRCFFYCATNTGTINNAVSTIDFIDCGGYNILTALSGYASYPVVRILGSDIGTTAATLAGGVTGNHRLRVKKSFYNGTEQQFLMSIGTITKNVGDSNVTLPSGVDSCIEIFSNLQSGNYTGYRNNNGGSIGYAAPVKLQAQEIYLPTGTHTLSLAINSQINNLTDQQCWIEAQLPTGAMFSTSNSPIPIRSTNSDWSNITSITFTLTSAGWVKLNVYFTFYDASNKVFILLKYRSQYMKCRWSDAEPIWELPVTIPATSNVLPAETAYGYIDAPQAGAFDLAAYEASRNDALDPQKLLLNYNPKNRGAVVSGLATVGGGSSVIGSSIIKGVI
jgi:hypothetical protein